METKKWFVGTAVLAMGVSLTIAKPLQAQTAPSSGDATKGKAEDEEGPFAPKGKTGKLRDTAPAPEQAAHEPAPFPEKPNAIGLDTVFGFGQTGTASAPTDVSVWSFILGATYDFKPSLSGRIRVPFGTGKITATDQAGYNAATFGNIELAVSFNRALGPRTKLPIELAVTVPTAGGDAFPPPSDPARGHRYQVQVAQQAARGLEDDALFAPHRLGVIPAVRLEYQRGPIITGGFVKVPLMFRVGGEDPPPPAAGETQTLSIKGTVVEGLLGGLFRYAILDGKMDLGARAWMVYVANEFIDDSTPNLSKPSKFQFVFEPEVRAAFGKVRAGAGFIWPMGGRVGNDPNSHGVRLLLAYTF
jgi:hypothetical protein